MKFLGLLFVSMMAASVSQATPVKIVFANVTKTKGMIDVGLFTSRATWESSATKPVPNRKLTAAKVEGDKLVTIEADLEPGDYAFFVYNDVNGSKALDETALGFPNEPYAFSNNFQLGWSKPGWEDIRFKVRKTPVTQIVTLTIPAK